MWSLELVLAECTPRSALFSGSDQFDQILKIVELLGMVPSVMLENQSQVNYNFFEISSPTCIQFIRNGNFDKSKRRQQSSSKWSHPRRLKVKVAVVASGSNSESVNNHQLWH
jgi:hypothetical protein